MEKGQERLNILKSKLKNWEHEFASQNDGRQPSRDDIRKNPKMAARYKEYQTLRQSASSSSTSLSNADNNSQSSLFFNSASQGTHSRTNSFVQQPVTETPRKAPQQQNSPHATPSKLYMVETPSTMRIRRFMDKDTVKATPQRNGKVLGLFDSLTPTKLSPVSARSKARDVKDKELLKSLPSADVNQSPSKSRPNTETSPSFITTPRKRKQDYDMLFQTPSKKVALANSHAQTPTDLFRTPKILRRYQSPNAELGSPPTPDIGKFLPRRPPIRGLSCMIAELRKVENEAFDDDEEALRELEDMENGIEGGSATNGQTSTANLSSKSNIETNTTLVNVPDIAQANPPAENSIIGKLTNAVQQFVKPYKKKGLKRQTRRVKMKPVRGPNDITEGSTLNTKQTKRPFLAKSISEPILETVNTVERPSLVKSLSQAVADENFDDDDDVPKTTRTSKKRRSPVVTEDEDEAGVDTVKPKKSKKLQKRRPATKETAIAENAGQGSEIEQKKPKARKRASTAGANYRRMKIKNHQSNKGGKFGRSGKFRR